MCDQFETVYINLDRAEDRKRSFEAQDAFSACGMRRLAAVDGQSLEKVEGAPLPRGHQGCVRSHVLAWDEARRTEAGPYTIIFEDDFHLPRDYASKIPQILEEAQGACDGRPADVVWLNRTMLNHDKEEPAITGHLRNAANPSHGTHAYAISREGAAKLMRMHEDDERHLFQVPIDVYFHRYLGAGQPLCMVAVEPQMGHVPPSATSTTEQD